MQDHATHRNPLSRKVSRFDVSGLARQHHTLGEAANALDIAFHTAYAIECISQLLIADDGERDSLTCQDESGDGQPLDDYTRGGLQTAVFTLARALRESLDQKADGWEGMRLLTVSGGKGEEAPEPPNQ